MSDVGETGTDRNGASFAEVVIPILVCALVSGAVGGALGMFAPSLWIAVPFLLCAVGAYAWAIARGGFDRLPRGRASWNAKSLRAGFLVWTWRNYPFLIAFGCMMIAQQEFSRLYGYGWSLLVVLACVAPLAIWSSARRKRVQAASADRQLDGPEAA